MKCQPMRLQIRILKSVWSVVKSGKSKSRIVQCKKFNKYTDVFRIFDKLKYIKYPKKYRRFYFCYYFSVVVKICEVFSDYLRVYVSLVCVLLPTLG